MTKTKFVASGLIRPLVEPRLARLGGAALVYVEG